MYERFTDRARKVMQLANQEAARLNHEFIGTEHILLALPRAEGIAYTILLDTCIYAYDIRRAVDALVRPGPEHVTLDKRPQTPRAKKVVEYAIEAARELSHNHVGTEHLLIGLCKEEGGIASQVLKSFGITETLVKEKLSRLLISVIERLMEKPKEKVALAPYFVLWWNAMDGWKVHGTSDDFVGAVASRRQAISNGVPKDRAIIVQAVEEIPGEVQ